MGAARQTHAARSASVSLRGRWFMEHRATKTRRRKGKHEGEAGISVFVIPFAPSCLRGSVLSARGDRASKCIKMQHVEKSSQGQALAGPAVVILGVGLG